MCDWVSFGSVCDGKKVCPKKSCMGTSAAYVKEYNGNLT